MSGSTDGRIGVGTAVADAPRPEPLAGVNAPTPRNVTIFGLSLLPWPTAVAVALAIVTPHGFDPRLWLVLLAVWSIVEFGLRNPHQVALVQAADGSYALWVRSWWSSLVGSPGRVVSLGPDTRLVRNRGILDCATGSLLELRIYRWQFGELIRAFEVAGFELHDECHRTGREGWRDLLYLALLVAAVVAGIVLAALVVRGH